VIILYTTSEEVTAAMGLTDRDLKEAQFANMDLERELRVDLFGWLPTHEAIAAYPDLPSPSALQLHQYDLLVLASKYFCASRMAESVALSAAKSITSEAGNAMGRIDFDPAGLRDAMYRGYNQAKASLEDILAPATTLTRTLIIKNITPAYDPIKAAS
jgi:hypothetical protein